MASTETEMANIVGCDCTSSPPSSSLPSQFFLAPAIGLIVIGVFSLASSALAVLGILKRQRFALLALLLLLPLIILVHFSFAAASLALATGVVNSDFISPFSSNIQYKLFDWKEFRVVFPQECYHGVNADVLVGYNSTTDDPIYQTFHHPLCKFWGECEASGSPLELSCCDARGRCDTVKPECISGSKCLLDFLRLVATPVAVVSFVGLVVEVAALILACMIQRGDPARNSLPPPMLTRRSSGGNRRNSEGDIAVEEIPR